MEQERIKFMLEEYKELRNEIMFLEKSIGQFSLAAIIASISLLSAIGAIFFRIELDQLRNLPPIAPYFFLFPPLILISVLFILGSHRRDIHRLGTYLQVFIEENIFGDGWEVRLDRFRQINEGESLDHVPKVFWVVYFLSVGLFFFTIYYENFNYYKMLHILIPMLEGIFLYLADKKFQSSSISIRAKYLKDWKKLNKTKIS